MNPKIKLSIRSEVEDKRKFHSHSDSLAFTFKKNEITRIGSSNTMPVQID